MSNSVYIIKKDGEVHFVASDNELDVHHYAGFRWGKYDKRVHIVSNPYQQVIDGCWEYNIQPWGVIDNSGEEPVRREIHDIDEPSAPKRFFWFSVLTIRFMIADLLQLHKDVIGNE
jgi:hypothetical protein